MPGSHPTSGPLEACEPSVDRASGRTSPEIMRIGACGDDCTACPRFRATASGDPAALERVRDIWVRIGLREPGFPTDDMACRGCRSANRCAWPAVRGCASSRGLSNCGRCQDYPCVTILPVFESTSALTEKLDAVCSREEAGMLSRAFLRKRINLDLEHSLTFPGSACGPPGDDPTGPGHAAAVCPSFREFTEDDVETLTEIMKRSFDEDAKRHLGRESGGPPGYDDGSFLGRYALDPRSDAFVILLGQKPIGAFIVWPGTDGVSFLGNLFIDPDCQDRGIGSTVWSMIESRYPGTRVWRTETPGFSLRNHHFYLNKCGFRMVGIDDPGDGSGPGFVMEKEMKRDGGVP